MSVAQGEQAFRTYKRRWFQYSLRTLLVVMLLAAIACSWLAVRMQKARKHREAVAAVSSTGGWISYGGKDDSSGALVMSSAPPGPAWLHRLLGEDFFGDVAYAFVSNDAGMESAASFNQLRFLCCKHVTDAGLECLNALPQLQVLDLQFGQVTDAGLEQLNGLNHLEALCLNGTRGVTDAGLRHVRELTQLQALLLAGTEVTDAGLEQVERLPQLRFVDLRQTGVTDAGVKKLQQALPNCVIER